MIRGPCAGRVMAERLADRAVAMRADYQLIARMQLQRAENCGHSLGNVAYPRGAGRVDAEEPGRALPRRRHEPADLHAVEAVRIAFGALAPGSSGPAHDDRCDAERAMVEVENVRVEAKGLQQGRVRGADFVSRGCRTNRLYEPKPLASSLIQKRSSPRIWPSGSPPFDKITLRDASLPGSHVSRT